MKNIEPFVIGREFSPNFRITRKYDIPEHGKLVYYPYFYPFNNYPYFISTYNVPTRHVSTDKKVLMVEGFGSKKHYTWIFITVILIILAMRL